MKPEYFWQIAVWVRTRISGKPWHCCNCSSYPSLPTVSNPTRQRLCHNDFDLAFVVYQRPSPASSVPDAGCTGHARLAGFRYGEPRGPKLARDACSPRGSRLLRRRLTLDMRPRQAFSSAGLTGYLRIPLKYTIVVSEELFLGFWSNDIYIRLAWSQPDRLFGMISHGAEDLYYSIRRCEAAEGGVDVIVERNYGVLVCNHR